jgi:bifunctional DNA-binding transcriptional regulator/antitoxin component of YhaV-PrlF toxin-antitoxin module
MNKVLQATSQGQITLPKSWRDKFSTNYYLVTASEDQLVIKPLVTESPLEKELAEAWQEYKAGKVVSHEEIMKKYGL